MSAPAEAWAVAMVASSAASYVVGYYTAPRFRQGCNECAAVMRRMLDKQAEVAHDMAHKGIGFKYDRPDIYDCADIRCPRNKRNIPPPSVDSKRRED